MACVALTGGWRDEQANELMEWRRKDRAEVQALLNFFVLVSTEMEEAAEAHDSTLVALISSLCWDGQVTKQEGLAHVILSTSEYAFVSWLTKGWFDD